MEIIPFDLYQKTILLLREQRRLFLDLGFILKQIKDGKLYKKMGDGGFDTWHSFLANPEISITPSTAEVYIKVYDFYIDKLGLPKEEVLEIPLSRLNMMKSKLEGLNQSEQLEMIEKSKSLSYGDFKIEVLDGGKEIKRAIQATRCQKCNKLVIKYDPEQVCTCSGGVDVTPY